MLLNTSLFAKKNYSFFSKNDNGFLIVQFDYSRDLSSNIMSNGNGFAFDFGLNPAYFFNKSFVFAPYCGINVAFGTEYDKEFVSDFIQHYKLPENYSYLNENVSYLNEKERIDYNSFEEGIRCTDYIKNGIIDEGTLKFTYGFILKSPFKYFPPVKIYKSYYNSSALRGVTHYYVGSSHKKYFNYDRFGWGTEVVLTRGYLFSDGKGSKGIGSIGLGSISLFLDFFDFKKTTIIQKDTDRNTRNVYLYEFTDQDFIDKYKKEWRIGIKIGLSII